MRQLSRALLVLILLPTPLFADTQARARMLIEQMDSRAKTLNYKGYFTFERGSQSTSYFIAHRVDNGQQSQRLFYMDGPEREVIIDHDVINRIHPGRKSKAATQGDAQAILSLTQLKSGLWDFYEADIIGEARIADRNTTKVLLKPNDIHRYPFVFFMDDETGLMLKMLILDQQGYPLERFHYVMIDYKDVSAADVAPTLEQHQKLERLEEDTSEYQSYQTENWEFHWVPEGFVKENTIIKPVDGARYDESHIYTDGLSVFTVFVEPVDKNTADSHDTSKQLGSTSAISHYVNIDDKVYVVTVVGEIPVTTARQIAISVKPKS